MPERSSRTAGRRGSVLLWTALSLIGIIPTLGLAIDASFLYLVRAKLSAAADASALASVASPELPAAESRARRYFQANFPDGFLNTSNSQLKVTVSGGDPAETRSVEVTAEVDAPLFFFGAFGVHQTKLRVASRAQGGTAAPRLIG